MLNRKSILVWAFAVLGFYYANDAFATCVKVLGADGRLLGCAVVEPYPPDVVTCSCSTATTSVQTNLSHHEVFLQVGDIDPALGEIKSLDNGVWEISPGVDGGNFTATFTMTNQTCSGTYSGPTGAPFPLGEDLGSGFCDYLEQWEAPTESCESTDPDFGHGNDCGGKDKGNPHGGPAQGGGGGKNADVRHNQTCAPSEDSTPDDPKSIMTYMAFCEGEVPESGRGIGSTTWRADNPNPPAQFTNGKQAGADAGVLKLQHGGFPIDPDTGLVDVARCAELYPATTVNGESVPEGLVFLLQEEWIGTCASDTQPPTADQSIPTLCTVDPDAEGCAGHTFFQYPRVVFNMTRVCSSDYGDQWELALYGPDDPNLRFSEGGPGEGWDNRGPLTPDVDRTCPLHISYVDGTIHPVTAGTAAITSRIEPMTALPPDQDIEPTCGEPVTKDSGQAWVTICGRDDLDVTTDIQTFKVKGNDILKVALESGQLPNASQFVDDPACGADEFGNADAFTDGRARYFTCTLGGQGLAQILTEKSNAGQCTHNPTQSHDKCPVGIQAEKETSESVPVRSQDIMDVGIIIQGGS